MINVNDETKIIKDLEEEYEFGKTGWKTVPNIKTFKASPYKIFIMLYQLFLVWSNKCLFLRNFSLNLLKGYTKNVESKKRKPSKYKIAVYALSEDFDSWV